MEVTIFDFLSDNLRLPQYMYSNTGIRAEFRAWANCKVQAWKVDNINLNDAGLKMSHKI